MVDFFILVIFLEKYFALFCIIRFVDPGFFAHQAVARIAGNALLRIADSLILPFSVSHFADFVKSQVDATEQQYGVEMTANGISLGR